MAEEFNLSASFIAALHKPSALLPIAKDRESLLYAIETFPVTIIIGQTGSGKSTQIPQFLEQAGWAAQGKVIAITQPRRVAVTTVAARVAEELRSPLGEKVGYSIRFEDVTSAKTKIKFLTDGLLLREALADPLLSRYSVIMVDEAHERSLSSDILLGVLKKIRRRREDLRIVISSATIEAEAVLNFFNQTTNDKATEKPASSAQLGKIIGLEGRMYPVDVLYLEEPAEDYVESAIKTVFDIHASEPDGDILLFLTGKEEIDTVVQAIGERAAASLRPNAPSLQALPLYAGLTTEQQLYVFEPAPERTRKVIVSTNIAEASVTVDGIAYVIDCGFVKLRAFNPRTGIDTLTVTPVSKASATQRAGRAGRTKAGKCYRLYTESVYSTLSNTTVPEIQRSNLAPVLLQLKALGIDNILRFDFPTPPPAELVTRGLELLFSLGALDDYTKLTRPLGLRMAELSAVEPMMAKCLLSAPARGCLQEILTIASMTSLQGGSSVVFTQTASSRHRGQNDHNGGSADDENYNRTYASGPIASWTTSRRKFAADEGDHLTLLNVYHAFTTPSRKDQKWCRENGISFKALSRAVSIRRQLMRYLERFGIDVYASSTSNVSHATPSSSRKAQPAPRNQYLSETIRRCLVSGYFTHAARMQPDGTFRTVSSSAGSSSLVLHAHPSSLLFNRKADWVVFHEIMQTSGKAAGDAAAAGQGKIYIRDITKVDKSWLVDEGGQYYQTSTT